MLSNSLCFVGWISPIVVLARCVFYELNGGHMFSVFKFLLFPVHTILSEPWKLGTYWHIWEQVWQFSGSKVCQYPLYIYFLSIRSFSCPVYIFINKKAHAVTNHSERKFMFISTASLINVHISVFIIHHPTIHSKSHCHICLNAFKMNLRKGCTSAIEMLQYHFLRETIGKRIVMGGARMPYTCIAKTTFPWKNFLSVMLECCT